MWTSDCSTHSLRLLSCIAVGAFSAWVGYHAWALPALPPVVLGEKGRQRKAWLSQGSSNPLVDGVLLRVGAWVAVVLSPAVADRLERVLRRAGHPAGLRPPELIASVVLSGVLGLALAALWLSCFEPSPFIIVVAVMPPLGPSLQIRQARAARVLAIERSLPVAMDLVGLCVRAGGDFPGALGFVVSELSDAHVVCRHELAQILEALALGRTREQALEAFGARVDSHAVRDFVAALVQSERRGVPLGDSLAAQAQTLRRARSVRAEEMAARAGVRMVVPMMMIVGCILSLLLGPMVIQGVAL